MPPCSRGRRRRPGYRIAAVGGVAGVAALRYGSVLERQVPGRDDVLPRRSRRPEANRMPTLSADRTTRYEAAPRAQAANRPARWDGV